MKKLILLVTLVLIMTTASACKQEAEIQGAIETVESLDDVETFSITDLLGREVIIPTNADRFVNVGVGALRLYTYVAPLDKLVGVEENEKDDSQTGVPYSMLNKEHWKSLPTIGIGGPRGSADPEMLVKVKPDVIFNTYAVSSEEADELQKKTGIPVVALSYGEVDVFNEDVYRSLRIIGEVTDSVDRAEEVVSTLEGYRNDLETRAGATANLEKPRVYVGALGNKGPQGIESTRGNYMLTNVLNAENVADETEISGSFFIDKEQLLLWQPEYLFIDLDGYEIVKKDYDDNRSFYEDINAVKNGKVYAQHPYVLLRTNLETAIADAYFMGTVLYPDSFADIDPEEKADEIYKFLLGEPFYQQMKSDYGPLGPVELTNDGN